jgi:hypothetical protein
MRGIFDLERGRSTTRRSRLTGIDVRRVCGACRRRLWSLRQSVDRARLQPDQSRFVARVQIAAGQEAAITLLDALWSSPRDASSSRPARSWALPHASGGQQLEHSASDPSRDAANKTALRHPSAPRGGTICASAASRWRSIGPTRSAGRSTASKKILMTGSPTGQRCARRVRKPPGRLDQLIDRRAAVPLKQFDDLRQLTIGAAEVGVLLSALP